MAERDGHPDLAELEALRTGEAQPETARHVGECPACSAALHDIELLAGEIAKAASRIDIPEALDRRMRMLARTRAAEVRGGIDLAERRRRVLTPLRALGGAAAAAVIVATGVFTMTRTPAPVAETAAHEMDIDSSGAVDIVDAYLMSRGLKRGAARSTWDFDLDGAVTDRDVAAVARRAVALTDLEGGI